MTKLGKNWQKNSPRVNWYDNIVKLHNKIIENYGGAKGVIDFGLLEATIERPFRGLADGTEIFPSDIDKAAALLEGIICFHPFVDGNKRTATIFTFEFLRELGYIIETDDKEIVEFTIRVSIREVGFSEIKKWIARIIK